MQAANRQLIDAHGTTACEAAPLTSCACHTQAACQTSHVQPRDQMERMERRLASRLAARRYDTNAWPDMHGTTACWAAPSVPAVPMLATRRHNTRPELLRTGTHSVWSAPSLPAVLATPTLYTDSLTGTRETSAGGVVHRPGPACGKSPSHPGRPHPGRAQPAPQPSALSIVLLQSACFSLL